jgi:GntR family transcriptional regulator
MRRTRHDLNGLNDLDKASFKPLYVQVCDSLIDFIRSYDLKEGGMLPSENQLLSRYNVSRNTIRMAIERLVRLKIAQKRRGKGTFVGPRKSPQFVRGLVGFEESLDQYGMTIENVLMEKTQIQQQIPWIEDIGGFPDKIAFYIKRLKVYNAAPVALEERYIAFAIAKRFNQTDFEEHCIFDLIETVPEFEIMQVNYILKASPLTAGESKMLKKNADSPALRRIGIYYDSLGNKIMLSRLTLSSERLAVRYDFHKRGNIWGLVN